MNEPMPWRLQLAGMAMQGEIARSYSALQVRTVRLYFDMADAMLAEHARTPQELKQSSEEGAAIRALIISLRKGSVELHNIHRFDLWNLVQDAADELERMLNESNK